MPRYQNEFSRNGMTYTEINRSHNNALFEGVSPEGLVGYELHVIKLKPAHPRATDAGKMILSSPSTTDWGTYGFTFVSKDKAMEKFRKLAEKSEQNVLDLQEPTLKEAS